MREDSVRRLTGSRLEDFLEVVWKSSSPEGLTVISQGFWVSFAFDSSLGILLQSKSSFESYLFLRWTLRYPHLAFLLGTIIEFSNLNMFSEAGGAGARRRRLCQSFLATTPSLIHFCCVSLMVSFNFAALDLLSTLPVEISVVSYCWSEFTRVDLFSGDSWIIVSDDTSLHLFILHSGKTCYGEEQSPPPTCLDGHLACSGELCKYQPTTALCLSAGDFLAASDSYSRSTTSLANEPAAIGPRFKSSWAWPSTLAEAASPVINLLKSRNLQHIVSQSILVLVSLVNLKSFDGFIEVFFLSLLQYHSLRKQFLVDSPDLLSFSSSSLVEDRILQSCLHSMNGDVLLDPFPSYCFTTRKQRYSDGHSDGK
ncbi:hypothetical protein YC2023_043012 [Brassica napus]